MEPESLEKSDPGEFPGTRLLTSFPGAAFAPGYKYTSLSFLPALLLL